MSSSELREVVFVYLLEEGSDAWRPTVATRMEDGTHLLHPAEDYDPEDEVWEFVPGTRVRCEVQTKHGGPDGSPREVLVAVERIG